MNYVDIFPIGVTEDNGAYIIGEAVRIPGLMEKIEAVKKPEPPITQDDEAVYVASSTTALRWDRETEERHHRETLTLIPIGWVEQEDGFIEYGDSRYACVVRIPLPDGEDGLHVCNFGYENPIQLTAEQFNALPIYTPE